MSYDNKEIEKRMQGAFDSFLRDLSGLRTNRASPAMLENIQVEAYGARSPITQVANVNVLDARTLSVSVWDASLVKLVEKAITEADIGLNPQAEGNVIRVAIPELTQERRQDIIKVAGKYAEQARIAVRNIRRDANDNIRKDEKASILSKDDARKIETNIQKTTDAFINKIDQALSAREADIATV